jgi:hypothetical protein
MADLRHAAQASIGRLGRHLVPPVRRSLARHFESLKLLSHIENIAGCIRTIECSATARVAPYAAAQCERDCCQGTFNVATIWYSRRRLRTEFVPDLSAPVIPT